MKASENIDQIMPALLAAQKNLRELSKDTQAYGYKYATLDQLLGMVRPALNEQGIVLMQEISSDVMPTEEGPVSLSICSTSLFHVSGQWLKTDDMASLIEERNKLSLMQCEGMNVTYSRRYQLQAMLGITAEEDTDAKKDTDSPRERVANARVAAVERASASIERRGYPRRGDPEHGVSEQEEALSSAYDPGLPE
jgi:hypothetical protein